MASRPPIPAELKRQVLLEAGHRCAIPSCKQPVTDIHHIIPWKDCSEHNFDNLIAICPNCHRLAHEGKIDKKSLRFYKTQLHTFQQSKLDPKDPIFGSNGRWDSRFLSFDSLPPDKLTFEYEYPHFNLDSPDFALLNATLEHEANTSLASEKDMVEGVSEYLSEYIQGVGNEFASSYRITLLTDTILSISTSIYTYGAGAAHGNFGITGKNYFLNPLKKFNLTDIFVDPDFALSRISKFCQFYLSFENHEEEPSDWIQRGAGPDWSNFGDFYLTPSEIILVFQPYQVGCYAEGTRYVPLTSRFLSPLILADLPCASLYG